MFDRLLYVDTLKSAGVPEDQARAHASALQTALLDTVATKDDVAGVRTDVEKIETSLHGDMKNLEIALRGEIAKLDASLRGEMAAQKTDILRWMFGMMIGFSGLMITAIKFIR